MRATLFLIVITVMLSACGGSSGSTGSEAMLADGREGLPDEGGEPLLPALGVEQVRYRVTIENDWGVDAFPQNFPDDAHLSLIGGATHNEAVSFWEMGRAIALCS